MSDRDSFSSNRDRVGNSRGQGMGAGKAYDISRLKVLIAEDNKYMQILLREILRSFGVRDTQAASDGAEALKTLQVYPADIILADWRMTPLDGLELTRMIREDTNPLTRFVPIILITGHTEYHRVQEAVDAGITEFLAKPVSASLLYSRIRNIIERPRPFVKSRRFVGPDRRRGKRTNKTHVGPLRRKGDD